MRIYLYLIVFMRCFTAFYIHIFKVYSSAKGKPLFIIINIMYYNIYVKTMDIILSVIDTSNNMVIDTMNFGNCPKGIAYNPYNHNMYIINHD